MFGLGVGDVVGDTAGEVVGLVVGDTEGDTVAEVVVGLRVKKKNNRDAQADGEMTGTTNPKSSARCMMMWGFTPAPGRSAAAAPAIAVRQSILAMS